MVRYTGKLTNGKVFDSNQSGSKKKKQPLKFKGELPCTSASCYISFIVGVGRVIRGWDEGLMTMTKGEKATLTIEPEWAYGRKGMPEVG